MKKIKLLLIGLLSFGLAGCSGWIGDRLSEQCVELYQYALTKDTETAKSYEDAAITDGEKVELVFPFAAANKVASKFELKAKSLKVNLERKYDGSEEINKKSFDVSLKKADKDKITEEKYLACAEINPILAEDENILKEYYSPAVVNEKYTTDNLALKATINLKEIYKLGAQDNVIKDIFKNHFKVTFGLTADIGVKTGLGSSLSLEYEVLTDADENVSFRLYKELGGLELSGMKKEFTVGEEFTTEGLVVKAVYTDKHLEPIVLTEDLYVVDSSAVNMTEAGTYEVKVTYGDFEAKYEITVSAEEEPSEPGEPSDPGEGE